MGIAPFPVAWRDPAIGRSVLWGAVGAAAVALTWPLEYLTRSLAYEAPPWLTGSNWTILLGGRYTLSAVVLEQRFLVKS